MTHSCEFNFDNLCIHCGREYFNAMEEADNVKEMCCRKMTVAVFYDRVDLEDPASVSIAGLRTSIYFCPWCGAKLSQYIDDEEGA